MDPIDVIQQMDPGPVRFTFDLKSGVTVSGELSKDEILAMFRDPTTDAPITTGLSNAQFVLRLPVDKLVKAQIGEKLFKGRK